MLIAAAATALRAFAPGDAYTCGPDADPSFWDMWVTPGCEQTEAPATTIIKDSVLAPYVEDFRKGVGDATKTMVTFWLNMPDPNVQDTTTGPGEAVSWLQSNFLWLAAVLMVGGIAVGAIKMMMDMNSKPLKAMMVMLLRYFLTATVGVILVAGGLTIADAFSQMILEKATIGTSFVDNIFSLFTNEAGVTSAAILLLGLLIAALLAGLQCAIMIARGGSLIALVATLPVTAAASGWDTGAEAFRKQCGWILAFIVYKPVAAVIYGLGFRLIGTDTNAAGNGLLQVLYGIALIGLAVLALPAVLRLVMPVVAPAASGRGAGAALGGATAAIAAGALRR
jgi:hypothetical protein